MKVLKFGGTSVGNTKSILNLKKIAESQQLPAIVVVSALGGVTDMLIGTAHAAAAGRMEYRDMVRAIVNRHHEMIYSVITRDRDGLLDEIDTLLEELSSIYQGVYLIHDLSEKTTATIVSYGERLSSRIVARLIDNSVLHDARKFMKTEVKHGRTFLDSELTRRLICEEFPQDKLGHMIHIVPGFISTSRDTGEITNLGRGGSDYTASVIASVLGAEALEIWTDVDGFMTADPRVIPTAYTIPALSYGEAMELSNFGAKVIYPPTIYPVCLHHIPIYVRNTFNPDGPGTVIRDNVENDGKPIKGISSIGGTALLTVSGLSMVGVIGVNRRIFTALADNGISVFMVSQASSETSTSIGMREQDAPEAVRVLNEEFAKEIKEGAIFPMHSECGLATVAIVGDNMKHIPGIAGKLFGTLGRSGISIISVAQGASETNISFVVHKDYLRKALNVIHDSFFLSEYKELNLFICGVGTVGGKLLEQIRSQQEKLKETHRLKLNVVGIASSRKAVFDRAGIDLSDYRALLDAAPESNTESLKHGVIGMNIFNSVFVDCTASREVATLYHTFIDHNVSVVAANKIAASASYETYRRLKDSALARGVKFLFETNVGAGLPIIGTINDLLSSGDRILKIEAVLSGTLNFIFNALSESVTFSKAVREARDLGFSEPDPRIDLSGQDVVRKLVILTREAGYRAEQEDVVKNLFVPESLLEGPIEEFWSRLPELDRDFECKRRQLEADDRRWRFVARMEDGKMSVGLEAVDSRHPFYNLEGSNNIVLLTTERYHEYPMLIQGYGAGAAVTAAGVFANIISSVGN